MTESAAASAVPAVRERPENADVARLWLGVLRAVADSAAHELRGALNGVSLNLEVVRARAEKPGAAPAAVVPFATAAADALDLLTERTEAILALTRAARRPLDVRATLRHLVVLLDPAIRAEGGALDFTDAAGQAATATDAEPDVARLVVAAVLVAAGAGERRVLCRIEVADAIIVRVEGVDGSREVAPAILRVAADAGIGVERNEQAIIVTLPAVAR